MEYKSKGTTIEGIPYNIMEEYTIYNVDNKKLHKKLVKRINKLYGAEVMKVINTHYPTKIVTDALELMETSEHMKARTNIRDIKKGDIFYVNNEKYIANEDAHYNSEEDCWIVYDKDNAGWFEEDIDKLVG